MNRFLKVCILFSCSLLTIKYALAEETQQAQPQPPLQAVESSPVTVNLSGFAWVEFERSSHFGYNGASAISNFDSSAANSQQEFSTFLSDIQLDISKDKTNLTSIFEVGEMIAGEAVTGGMQGGRQRVFEVRNMFLTHEFNSNWSVRAGLMNMSTDPNSFILSDHHSALWLDYKHEGFVGSLWTAKARDVKPGSGVNTTPVNPTLPQQATPIYPDTYAGFTVSPQLSDETKLTVYGIYRKTKESLNDSTSTAQLGSSEYSWGGVTVDHNFSEYHSMQITGIENQGKFKADGVDASDSFRTHLADIKLLASYKESGWDFLIEGLMTSGGSETSAIGSRKSFSSPNPGTASLLTIATSDGADDLPGSLKESVIGNLSQSEGLQIGVLKIKKTFTDKLSAFIRYGYLRSTAKNLSTGSQEMGREVDLNLSYALSTSTQLLLDYGQFLPGSFYAKNEPAQLFTTRMKFTF